MLTQFRLGPSQSTLIRRCQMIYIYHLCLQLIQGNTKRRIVTRHVYLYRCRCYNYSTATLMLASKESRLRAGEWRNYFFLSELKTLANQFTADTSCNPLTTGSTAELQLGTRRNRMGKRRRMNWFFKIKKFDSGSNNFLFNFIQKTNLSFFLKTKRLLHVTIVF